MGWGRQSRLGDEIYCTTISSSLKKHGVTRNSMKSYFVWLLICEKLDMVYLMSYSPTQTCRAYFSWVWRKMAAKEKVILYLNWKYEQPFLTKRILLQKLWWAIRNCQPQKSSCVGSYFFAIVLPISSNCMLIVRLSWFASWDHQSKSTPRGTNAKSSV